MNSNRKTIQFSKLNIKFVVSNLTTNFTANFTANFTTNLTANLTTKKNWLLLLISLGTIFPNIIFAAPKSIVQLNIAKRPLVKNRPWESEKISKQTHLGTVITKDLILIKALAIQDASNINVQSFDGSKKYSAKIAHIDWEMNLAVVKVTDPDFSEHTTPAKLADEFEIGTETTIWRRRSETRLLAGKAQLFTVEHRRSQTGYNQNLIQLYQTQMTNLGWSEPLFSNNRLAGIAINQNKSYIDVIPSNSIKKFISSFKNNSSDSIPSLGISFQKLTDPATRSWLNFPDSLSGVRVSKTLKDNDPDGLRLNDIIIKINGTNIDNNGLYQHKKWDQVSLIHLIDIADKQEKIDLLIWREQKQHQLSIKPRFFTSKDFPIVYKHHVDNPPYLIVGGFVFQEISEFFLHQWGNNWFDRAPTYLINFYLNENSPSEDHKQIVISNIFKDSFNTGYEDVKLGVLDSINSTKIKDLNHLIENLNKGKDNKFLVFTLRNTPGTIIFETANISSANKRIQKTYLLRKNLNFWPRD